MGTKSDATSAPPSPHSFCLRGTSAGVGNNASTKAGATAVIKQANADIAAAQNILILGGGPIGIEIAGEIREEMPWKKVTLVTSKELHPSPTVEFSEKFRARLRKKLEEVRAYVCVSSSLIFETSSNA